DAGAGGAGVGPSAGGSGVGGAGIGGAMGEFAGATGTDDGGRCSASASSTLPGVSLGFFNVQCSYTQAEAAAGIRFDYELRVDHSLSEVHPKQQDIGGCQQPDSSGLIIGFQIS